jgi:hypothetical protein
MATQTFEPRLSFIGSTADYYDWLDNQSGQVVTAWRRRPSNFESYDVRNSRFGGGTQALIGQVWRLSSLGELYAKPTKGKAFKTNTTSLCSAVTAMLNRI